MDRDLNVAERYTPCATYFHDSDCVEYVKLDGFCVYDRVDEFLTLVLDRTTKNLVGFKLKGFKNIFTKQLKPVFELDDRQFLRLVPVIEAVCKVIGEQLTDDYDRRQSYQAVRNMAANDDIRLASVYIDKIAA